jgi:hypothetical protein
MVDVADGERYAHVDDAELARAVRITHAHTEAATKTATTESSAEKNLDAKGAAKL